MKMICFNKISAYQICSIIEQIAYRKTLRILKYLEAEGLNTLFLYNANYNHIKKWIDNRLQLINKN